MRPSEKTSQHVTPYDHYICRQNNTTCNDIYIQIEYNIMHGVSLSKLLASYLDFNVNTGRSGPGEVGPG